MRGCENAGTSRKLAGVFLFLAVWGGAPVVRSTEARYGHLPYEEAPASALTDAGRYRRSGRLVRLRGEAAEAFKKMVRAARAGGVRIIPISGFRTVDYQRGLFRRATARYGSEEKAARWVAPPGFSEHHTGWALDVGDETVSTADVDPSFEKTAAFRWMEANGPRFGFTLSFPRGNPGGVSYEPWHWRYRKDAGR